MRMQFSISRLCGTTSMVAIAAATMLGSAAQPAKALDGIYGGGSSLVSLALRQAFDCYAGATLTGDDYAGKLPAACPSTTSPAVQGLYAAVGSGNGFRGFITNDPKQFFLGTPNPVNLPALPPVFIDSLSGDANFNTYPYPHVDFGASDSPLAAPVAPATLTTASYSSFNTTTNWDVAGITQAVSAAASSTVSYNTANFGAPIQLPLIEAPVAIAINVNDSDSALWTINSQLSQPDGAHLNTPAGSAIQLSTAQVCAIFSGTVTDWSDSSTSIAYRDNVGAIQHQLFHAANVGNGSAAAPYTDSSLPIVVAYRSDGSGTSYIVTNYLKSSCAQLDDGSNGYAAIFGASNLPSTSFTNLTTNINTVKGVNVLAATYNGSHPWIGASGTPAVAEAINNVASSGSTVYAGRIGYVSADFSQPYQLVNNVTYAPVSASVQNEAQRVAGLYVPTSVTPGTAGSFVAPTPAAADLAFAGLTAPSSTSTYADWNLYGQVYPTTTTPSLTISGGINIGGKSILGIPTTAGAYPVVGTAFMALYSCYDTTARADRLKGFLNWFYGSSSPAGVLLQNNGFNQLASSLRTAAVSVAGSVGGAGSPTSCSGKSGAL